MNKTDEKVKEYIQRAIELLIPYEARGVGYIDTIVATAKMIQDEEIREEIKIKGKIKRKFRNELLGSQFETSDL